MSATILVTPTGLGKHCWISRPDTKFNPEGTYQTNLLLDKESEEVQALCKHIKKAFKEAQKPKKKAGKIPFWENEEGNIEMKFLQKAVIHTKSGEIFKKTVAILDSKKHPIKPNIGNGTSMKVAFEISPPYDYNGCGITLRLKAVQIIDLVEYVPGQEFGFDEEEGFEGSTTDEMEATIDEAEEIETDTGKEDEDDSPF